MFTTFDVIFRAHYQRLFGSTAITGERPFFLEIPYGLFWVEKVSCESYTVSFVKRIVGPASSVCSSDPIIRLVGVEVYLDHRYGLLFSCRESEA